MKIKIFQVDAFAEKLFTGNPAAVCVLNTWLDDDIMQKIAAENNLAETAFIVNKGNGYDIRWFTPTIEVDLCGHATLASAYVIFNFLDFKDNEIIFNSPQSGELRVTEVGDELFLNFPVDKLERSDNIKEIEECIGIKPIEVLKGKSDYIAIVEREEEVANMIPNLTAIAKLDARGLIVTAVGNNVDFVSRFFGPQSGIDEDPVTGSAHTSLIPLWSAKLNKQDMVAKQLSQRGGRLICMHDGDRCSIGGKANLYLVGELYIE
ncbi:MAG: PhzF family phenazine biosynthesis protein [Bacteroidetes bacterium]|nr:PhzF family phenazine biosynthesis protein [Bacteroidota bacterium]